MMLMILSHQPASKYYRSLSEAIYSLRYTLSVKFCAREREEGGALKFFGSGVRK